MQQDDGECALDQLLDDLMVEADIDEDAEYTGL